MDKTSPYSIEHLLARGEGETIEFKESFDEEALESIAAFANTRGGSVLVGVTDDGQVRGLQLGKETLRDWANRIAQSVHVNPGIGSRNLEEKTIVLIEVAESPVKPVPCRGRYFIRVDKSNRQMTEDDLTRIILDKVGSTWDEIAESRATLEDIDPAKFKRFRDLCNQKGRRSIPAAETDPQILEKLKLLHDGKPTRAAILLFGKDPQQFYSSAILKIGRFRSETLIVDDREISGSLFDQVDGAMGYFREHLQTRFERHGTPARDVIWEYPLDALREAVLNVACHRDYVDVGQSQIRWYDDHLTILNPGGLPPPLTLEELKHQHASKPRNKKIAEMFFYAGWIEHWGSGTLQILDACKAAELPEPTFEEKQGGLWLTFPARKEPRPHVPTHVSIHVTAHVGKLLDVAGKKPRSRAELQKLVGLKNRVYFLKRYLEPLISAGWLERTIPDKPRSVLQRYRTTVAGTQAMEKPQRDQKRTTKRLKRRK